MNFSGLDFWGPHPNLLEIEKYVVVYITMIKWYNGVLRCSLTVTAKKCTTKCDVRAELSFLY